MTDKLQEEWLSLAGVAGMLGVHPSTARLWSNEGILPVHHTPGKRRRYRRSEVELWMKTSREKQPMEPARAMQSAVGQLRMQIAEGRLEAEPWYQKLDQNARAQYRLSGMTLVRGLMSSLAGEESEGIAEAYALGYEYAARGRRYGLSSVEAARAFLFFRSALLEALVNAYEQAKAPGVAWGKMLHKLHSFTDRILLALLETYRTFDETHS